MGHININNLSNKIKNLFKQIFHNAGKHFIGGYIEDETIGGKAVLVFYFNYYQPMFNEFKNSFYGICGYDQSKKAWYLPASWFVKSRLRNFVQKYNMQVSTSTVHLLQSIPENFPEKPDKYSEKFFLTPEEWKKILE